MSSSDRNVIDQRWAQHYEGASRRRKSRGWHRREDRPARTRPGRRRLYAAAVVAFVTLVALALALPR